LLVVSESWFYRNNSFS